MSNIRLGDVATSRKGKKPASLAGKPSQAHNIPYVDIKAFEKGKIDNYCDGANVVFCEEGDLLLVWDGSRSGLVGRAVKGAIGSTLARIDSSQINQSYLYYFLVSKFQDLNTRQRGSGTPHVDPNVLWNFNIYLPSEHEQDKIVLKIEEIFSEIAKVDESIELSKQALVSYRQSLLNSLLAGKETSTIGDLVSEVRYGTSKKCTYDDSLTPVLRIPNIVKGKIDTQDLKYARFENDEVQKLALKIGDLLVIRSNGSPSIVGRCAEVTEKDQGFLYAGYLIRLRFDPKKHNPKFYKYLLSSPRLREQIESKAKSSSGVNNINAEELKSLVVPKLSLEEQNRIVEILDEKASEAEALRIVVNETKLRLKNLKQSVLSKAFKGELI